MTWQLCSRSRFNSDIMADVVALRSWGVFLSLLKRIHFKEISILHFPYSYSLFLLLRQLECPSVHSFQFIAEMCTIPAIVALIRRIRPLKVCLRDQTKGGRPSAAAAAVGGNSK